MSEWKPIESAPRDGKFLLWCADLAYDYALKCKGPVGVVFGFAHEGFIRAEGMSGDWTFTYWMPLPPPPTGEKI